MQCCQRAKAKQVVINAQDALLSWQCSIRQKASQRPMMIVFWPNSQKVRLETFDTKTPLQHTSWFISIKHHSPATAPGFLCPSLGSRSATDLRLPDPPRSLLRPARSVAAPSPGLFYVWLFSACTTAPFAGSTSFE